MKRIAKSIQNQRKKGERDMKENLKSKRGITLIALIITIIILLILAMVTINILINQGIIGHANNAVRGYEVAEEKELISLAYQNYKMDKQNPNVEAQLIVDGANGNEPIDKDDEGVWYIVFDKTKNGYELTENGTVSNAEEKWRKSGDTITKGEYTLKIGDYVNYSAKVPEVSITEDSPIIKNLSQYSGNTAEESNTPSKISQETLSWRIWDVQNGKIRLISSLPTKNSKIRIEGYDGYNNVVYLINEACDELYSSSYASARNLNVNDIEDKLNEAGIQARDSYTYNSSVPADYGTEHTGEHLSIAGNYPKIYSYEKGCKRLNGVEVNGTLGISEQRELISGSGSTNKQFTTTQTAWEYREKTQRRNKTM